MWMLLLLAISVAALAGELTEAQKRAIEERIAERGLNQYGDPRGTMYMGGTPLFDEATGRTRDRWEFLADKHPELVREVTGQAPPAKPSPRPVTRPAR